VVMIMAITLRGVRPRRNSSQGIAAPRAVR
jgi:hypothetical protein